MKKKQNKRYEFPANRRTEFAKFTDPDVFPLEPNTEEADLSEDSFFHDDPPMPVQGPDVF